MKKFIYFIITACLFTAAVITPVHADGSSRRAEFVILLDVTPSMGTAGSADGNDPEQRDGSDSIYRISTEAIKFFTELCLTDPRVDVTLSLIVYHGGFDDTATWGPHLATVFESRDIRRAEDFEYVKGKIGEILSGKVTCINTKEEFICWNRGYTDITPPLLEAQRILSGPPSEAVKKGILLFTDGNIQLQDESGNAVNNIKDACKDIVRGLKSSDIKFYPVGLMGRAEFDEVFLADLAEIHEYILDTPLLVDRTSENEEEWDDITKIHDFFEKIFRDLFGIPQREPVIFRPNENDYGHREPIEVSGITREIAIVITHGSELELSIYATGEDGEEILMNDDPSVTISKSATYLIITIRDPVHSSWAIEVIGTEGDRIGINVIPFDDISITLSLIEGQDNLYDIYLFDNFIPDGSAHSRGRINSEEIYETLDFTALLINTADQRRSNIGGYINEHKDGYEVRIPGNLQSGEYIMRISMKIDGHFHEEIDVLLNIEQPEEILILSTEADLDTDILAGTEIIFYAELHRNGEPVSLPEPDADESGLELILKINGVNSGAMTFSDGRYEAVIPFYGAGVYSVYSVIEGLSVYTPSIGHINYILESLPAEVSVTLPALREAAVIDEGLNFYLTRRDEYNLITVQQIYISEDAELLKNVLNNSSADTAGVMYIDITENSGETYFVPKEDILDIFKPQLISDLHLFYFIREVVNQIEFVHTPPEDKEDFFEIDDFEPWGESMLGIILSVVGIVLLSVIAYLLFYLLSKTVKIRIKLAGSNDFRIINHKKPLLITANQNAQKQSAQEVFIINVPPNYGLEDADLAKTSALSDNLKIPAFYRTVQTISKHSNISIQPGEKLRLDGTKKFSLTSNGTIIAEFECTIIK